MAVSIAQINRYINDRIVTVEGEIKQTREWMIESVTNSVYYSNQLAIGQAKLSLLYDLRTLVNDGKKSEKAITDPADPEPSPTPSTDRQPD